MNKKQFLLAIALPAFTNVNSQTYVYVIPSTGHAVLGASDVENSEQWDRVFQVNGNEHAKSLVSSSNVISGQWSHNYGFYGAPAGGISGTFTNHPFSLMTGKISRVTIATNGNVGIGAIDPAQKLDIRGNAIVNGVLIASISDPNIGGTLQISNPSKTARNAAFDWKIMNMSGGYGNSLQFWAYDAVGCADPNGLCNSRFTIMDNGNVGVGISSPNEKLAVNGNIRAKEIKVEATNWPDYVFEKDYKNLGLAELDAYIKKNKHLPEVPSAKEIEANGVELGELNKLLLKKLEEMTLLMINMDRDMTNLKQEVKDLKLLKNPN